MTAELVGKYDRIAQGFAESSYANLSFYMERRFVIATTWGKTIRPGDSVLELGCGDGYLAQLFVEHGLRYCGADMSPKMVTVAQQRLLDAGLRGEFLVTDVSQLNLNRTFDAMVCYMRSFFTYVADPLAVLKRLRPSVGKKIIVDLEPRRSIPVKAAVDILRRAGFENVGWRPFLVPEEKKMPRGVLKSLVVCEEIPVLRIVPLRWKFHALLKGEVC